MEVGDMIQFGINNGVAVIFAVLLFLQLKEMNKQHNDEAKGFQQAIENNTVAITELMTFIREVWK